ncbi:thiamine pyrophosphate-requiring protein [Ravibacter arvi]|uniref:Thiamine pyrophosphate-requiring protein n=1 Tax=Ravibacter arvi TaxID=2051041 RepID=A0ABP8M3G1_9BACT
MLVSDFILSRMAEWGIERLFGYPGDGINGILGAMNRQDRIRFIQARHEESAAFMACAHAKFTGRTGVCLATSGPGAIHLLNGLYDARMDHQPVVAVVGQQRRMSLGSNYQQEVDLVSLFKDVAHEYVQMVTVPSQTRQVIDRAFRIASEKRTVTVVIVPLDVQEEKMEQTPKRTHGNVVTGVGHSFAKTIPTYEELKNAAAILNQSERVAILVGAGAFGAEEEVSQIAELLGAGVAKALLGKMVLPDDLPYVTGSIGMLGTKPSWELMEGCDTLLMIGSSFPYAEYLPEPGKARGIQIDSDAQRLSIRYPMEVNLLGDSKATLQRLIPLLQYKSDRSWRKEVEKQVAKWKEVVESRAMQPADPINPQRVVMELSQRLPDKCIVSADSGTCAFWYARNLTCRRGMKGSLSGNLASMGPAVPYAIAAKFAYPDRIPIALVGDGAMQMICMNELITIAKYWKEWENPGLLVVVFNNCDLNMVTWEQRILSGEAKYEASQDIPDVPYAEFAKLLGLAGMRVEEEDEIGPALDSLLDAGRPAVLDVVTDPNVPIVPSHISMENLSNYFKALMKGDAEQFPMIRQTIRELMQGGIA